MLRMHGWLCGKGGMLFLDKQTTMQKIALQLILNRIKKIE